MDPIDNLNAYCTSPLCPKCKYAKKSDKLTNVLRNIALAMGGVYHCISCGKPVAMRATYRTHAESCPYRLRVGRENPKTVSRLKPAEQNKRLKVSMVRIKPMHQDFETEFVGILKILCIQINSIGYFENKSIDDLVTELKNNIDVNFVEFIRKFHTFLRNFLLTCKYIFFNIFPLYD